MAEDIAQEIRNQEAIAKSTVVEAKAEGAKLVAMAEAEAERAIRAARQQCHREWRKRTADAECAADKAAQEKNAIGEREAHEFYDLHSSKTEDVADWLVSEITDTQRLLTGGH